MAKKLILFLGLFLELLSIAGAWAIYYFSIKRMGMARHVLYLNSIWEKRYPVDLLIQSSLLIVAALGLLNWLHYRNHRPHDGILPRVLLIQLMVFTAGYLWFALSFTTRAVRVYYLLLMIFFLLTLIGSLLTWLMNRMGHHQPALKIP